MDTLCRFLFLRFRHGRQLLGSLVCFFILLHLFEKGSTLKGKHLLPQGANSFLLEKTPFQTRTKRILTELKCLYISLNAIVCFMWGATSENGPYAF